MANLRSYFQYIFKRLREIGSASLARKLVAA